MSGKKFNEAVKSLDLTKLYDAKEALDLLVKSSYVKFDETVEFHARLGVDGRQADQQIRGVVVLPAGTGKKLKVLVIAKGDKQDEATKAGADIVGAEDVVAKIAGGWLDFDVCITTPDMMGVVGRVAKVLGPKGLMPNPKSGTVTTNLAKAIADVKAGKVEYRLDKNNIVHCSIGKVSFGADKLYENFKTLLEAITKAKPASAKGTYFKSLTLSTTMGPGLKIETSI